MRIFIFPNDLKYRILEAAKIRREPIWALSEQNERGLFLERVGRLYQVPVDLAAWCRRESVKGGGRGALNGVWERRRKQRQRTSFSAASHRYAVTDGQELGAFR